MRKVFLDSDIILDALLERPIFDLPAMNLFALAYQRQIEIFTTPVVFVNVNYILKKFDPANRLELLKKLRLIVTIIETGESIIDLSLKSAFSDFEDAVQYYAARSVGADFIITRNIKDYKQSEIPVLTADQFLKTL